MYQFDPDPNGSPLLEEVKAFSRTNLQREALIAEYVNLVAAEPAQGVVLDSYRRRDIAFFFLSRAQTLSALSELYRESARHRRTHAKLIVLQRPDDPEAFVQRDNLENAAVGLDVESERYETNAREMQDWYAKWLELAQE